MAEIAEIPKSLPSSFASLAAMFCTLLLCWQGATKRWYLAGISRLELAF
jgi:hypothetical protein